MAPLLHYYAPPVALSPSFLSTVPAAAIFGGFHLPDNIEAVDHQLFPPHVEIKQGELLAYQICRKLRESRHFGTVHLSSVQQVHQRVISLPPAEFEEKLGDLRDTPLRDIGIPHPLSRPDDVKPVHDQLLLPHVLKAEKGEFLTHYIGRKCEKASYLCPVDVPSGDQVHNGILAMLPTNVQQKPCYFVDAPLRDGLWIEHATRNDLYGFIG
mmetsp:Transcript_12937/g.24736  ORF Transcript_12937/g.24736 Transcript_12937/m.24736 type:complete len:211 (+) Transcript_12937:166-798(+)